jgi:Kef-type K+ transport system membrane component KefB
VAQLSIAFFLQMAVVLAVCRGVGWLAQRYLGQPQVVGEMIAGVLLGPSLLGLLGLLAPDVQQFVFTPESRGVLYVGAQLGVGLYMCLVGLGFRTDELRANVHKAASVSIAGMVVPFAPAMAATPWLMTVPGLSRRPPRSSTRRCSWALRLRSRLFRCWPASSMSAV